MPGQGAMEPISERRRAGGGSGAIHGEPVGWRGPLEGDASAGRPDGHSRAGGRAGPEPQRPLVRPPWTSGSDCRSDPGVDPCGGGRGRVSRVSRRASRQGQGRASSRAGRAHRPASPGRVRRVPQGPPVPIVGGQPFGLRRRVRPLPIHLTPGAIREDRAPSGASHADVRRSASQHRHDLLLRGSDHVRQQGQPDLRRRAVQDAVHLLVLTGLRRIRSQCAIRRTPALLCRPSPAGPARPRAGTSCSHPLMGPGSPGTVRPHSNPAGPGS